jgi:hypothetical protein
MAWKRTLPRTTTNIRNPQIRSSFERHGRVNDPWERLLPDKVAEVEADGVDDAASERVSVELWLWSHGFVVSVQLPDEGVKSSGSKEEGRDLCAISNPSSGVVHVL